MHLEVVDNLTATSFIMCLRRLAAAKGMPTLILSDNHKTFVTGETNPTERISWVADGGTPRRVASLRAAPNIPNKEPWTKQGG